MSTETEPSPVTDPERLLGVRVTAAADGGARMVIHTRGTDGAVREADLTLEPYVADMLRRGALTIPDRQAPPADTAEVQRRLALIADAGPRTAPVRIQRRRTAGWTAPVDAEGRKPIYVGRGSKWGNPCRQVRLPALDGSEWEPEGRLGKTSGQQHAFVHPDKTVTWHLVQDATREQAVAMYQDWIGRRSDLADAARLELVGRDLMCWCRPGDPCHADWLLLVANSPKPLEAFVDHSPKPTFLTT